MKYLIPATGVVLLAFFVGWNVFLSFNDNEKQVETGKQLNERELAKAIKYRIEVSNPGNELIKDSSLLIAIPALW